VQRHQTVLQRLSKREECRDVNFPSLKLSALRKVVLSGISNDNSIKIDYVYSIGLFLFFFMADFGTLPSIDPSFSQTSLFAPPNPELLLLFHLETSISFDSFSNSSSGGSMLTSRAFSLGQRLVSFEDEF
jgi:hypothetical protein